VRGPQLAQWLTELNFPMEKDSHMVFDLVKEFLQNAGQSQMILQVCFILFVCCYYVGGITPELSACSEGFLYVLHNHLL
jgi:hypothetical protein